MKPIGISDRDFPFPILGTNLNAEWQSPQTLMFLLMRMVDPGDAMRSAKARARFSLRYFNFASLPCWSITKAHGFSPGHNRFPWSITNLLPYIMDLSYLRMCVAINHKHAHGIILHRHPTTIFLEKYWFFFQSGRHVDFLSMIWDIIAP